MSFRQTKPRWPGHPDESRSKLEAIGIPEAALASETAFKAYLTDGSVAGSQQTLAAMEDTSFWMLFDIVTSWYDMEATTFWALERRRNRQ